MDNTVIVALIAFAGSALGTFAGILINSKLTNYRLEQLEKKVDEYNNVKTRTSELETWRESVDGSITELKNKISNLENLHMKS